MNAKELAKKLDGSEYPFDCAPSLKQTKEQAKADNLVIVYGASDDLMEFDGAIYDEIGAYGGGEAYLNQNGLIVNKCDCDDCPYFKTLMAGAQKIEALWLEDGEISWKYKTDIPHEVFNIMEDEEIYCTGIVFSLDDLK